MKTLRILTLSLCLCCMLSTNLFAAVTAKQPFNGVTLQGWKPVNPNIVSKWIVGRASLDKENERTICAQTLLKIDEKFLEGDLINFVESNWQEKPRGGVDLCTEEVYGDCIVEIEFMVPKGSNSGVYLMGEYEVQVLDSWGKQGNLSQGDVGAIYSAAAPKENASLPPGEWQKFVIDFQAPRFDADGNKTQKAKFLKITLNGKVVQEDVEVEKSTGGGITGKEAAKGPLMLQGNHGPIAFRNIMIYEK
ncbi:MAG: DUF1080 domain-containing protein [Planctomycetaceae bacterium]|nr:DUF1080 domain-containing protein [Planctomycetaceae bacterium]